MSQHSKPELCVLLEGLLEKNDLTGVQDMDVTSSMKGELLSFYIQKKMFDMVHLLLLAGWRNRFALRQAITMYLIQTSVIEQMECLKILWLLAPYCTDEFNKTLHILVSKELVNGVAKPSVLTTTMIILQHGAEITPEMMKEACFNSNWRMVRLFLANGFRPEHDTSDTVICAGHCMYNGNFPLFKRFISYLSDQYFIWQLMWDCLESRAPDFFSYFIHEHCGIDLLMENQGLRVASMMNRAIWNIIPDMYQNMLVEREQEYYGTEVVVEEEPEQAFPPVFTESEYTAKTGKMLEIRNLGSEEGCSVMGTPLEEGSVVFCCTQCRNAAAKYAMELWWARNPSCPMCRWSGAFVQMIVDTN